MPRHSRTKSGTRIYHVVIKGADRQLLFEETKDYIKYLEILEYYKQECNFEIFAYCLMSNHIHLLIRHSIDCSLQTIFRRLNTTYAIWFNMKYNRTGFVQNDRFFSEPVEDEKYLLTVVKYIHFNPTKAGLEQAPGASYPWNSYHEYFSFPPKLIDTSFFLETIGGIVPFLLLHSVTSEEKCLDIDQSRSRLPDDVALDIVHKISHCNSVTEFQNLTLAQRNEFILSIHKKGVSIRQLNRLTGTPRGVIQRIISKGKEQQS